MDKKTQLLILRTLKILLVSDPSDHFDKQKNEVFEEILKVSRELKQDTKSTPEGCGKKLYNAHDDGDRYYDEVCGCEGWLCNECRSSTQEEQFNKECRKLRKESWNELMDKSDGDYDKAMEFLNNLNDAKDRIDSGDYLTEKEFFREDTQDVPYKECPKCKINYAICNCMNDTNSVPEKTENSVPEKVVQKGCGKHISYHFGEPVDCGDFNLGQYNYCDKCKENNIFMTDKLIESGVALEKRVEILEKKFQEDRQDEPFIDTVEGELCKCGHDYYWHLGSKPFSGECYEKPCSYKDCKCLVFIKKKSEVEDTKKS